MCEETTAQADPYFIDFGKRVRDVQAAMAQAAEIYDAIPANADGSNRKGKT